MTNNEAKLQNKHWISKQILKNISGKKQVYITNFAQQKEQAWKGQLRVKCKSLKNATANKLRALKGNYYI